MAVAVQPSAVLERVITCNWVNNVQVFKGKNMKKIIIYTLAMTAISYAYADCVDTGIVYVSCKPGYYLSSGDCVRCPEYGDTYGTTTDKNKGDISSCYLSAGTYYDPKGTFEYTENCSYK